MTRVIGDDASRQGFAVLFRIGELRLGLRPGARIFLARNGVGGPGLRPRRRGFRRFDFRVIIHRSGLLCGERGKGDPVLSPDLHDKPGPLLLQDPLHALDRVALAVEEMANAAQKVDIVRTIIAPAAAAFQRADLSKSGFPETQDVLRQIEVVGDLADRAEGVRAFFDRR